MPMVRVQLSVALDPAQRSALLKGLSRATAQALRKPEAYTMALLETEVPLLMAGEEGPAAFVEVRAVGTITADQARALSAALSGLVASTAGVDAERIYSNFIAMPGAMWGHGASTFG